MSKTRAKENWGRRHKTIATIGAYGGIFKNFDSARISTFNKSLVANLSLKVRQGLRLLSRHIISFGHLCFLSWHRVKKCLEIQVRENGARSRGVTLNFKRTLHYNVGRDFRSSPLFPGWKNTIREGLYRHNEKIYTRYPRYLGTDTNTWACNVHSKRKREANGFSVCPLPVHCKDLHNQNIPERLIAIFDRIGESIHGYRRCLRWCNRCYQTADKHLNNLPDYQPLKKVFFIPFFKMKDTLNYAYPRYKFSWELFFTLFREHIPTIP